MLLLIAAATHFSGSGNLDNIKSKTVGDGQHGTARWANRKEIQQTYRHIPFHVSEWRSGKNLPKAQGLVLGCVGKKNAVTALVEMVNLALSTEDDIIVCASFLDNLRRNTQ